MKIIMLITALCLPIMAQDFHGVLLADGPMDPESKAVMPLLVNNTSKFVLGFAVQTPTTLEGVIGFESLVRGTGVAPGERRAMPGIGMFSFATKDNAAGSIGGMEIKAVLFHDGTFYGPDVVFQDFSHGIEMIRSLARDVQYSEDKQAALEHHKRGGGPAGDVRTTQRLATTSEILLRIREKEGDAAMDAAVTRLAALPDVVRGE